ncbi:Hypothetical protein HDN1F_19350 [gamma proteobacterium HdN1]|nr:Hypothetical protein HDN1F_19350 [gamma proteobacterium HdN1]
MQSYAKHSATAAFGGAFGLWIMAFLTAMLGLRARFAKHALNRKNTISTACLLLCGLSLMGANTSRFGFRGSILMGRRGQVTT